MRAKDDADLRMDPPPELVIEVDVSRTSLDRFPKFVRHGGAKAATEFVEASTRQTSTTWLKAVRLGLRS